MRFVRPGAFVALVVAAGCGGPALAPAGLECKGTVALPGGASYPEGIMYFAAAPGGTGRDELTRVTNGAFAFPTGVFAGKYKVYFDKDLAPGKTSPVPSKYRSADKTDIEIDITKAEPDLKIVVK